MDLGIRVSRSGDPPDRGGAPIIPDGRGPTSFTNRLADPDSRRTYANAFNDTHSYRLSTASVADENTYRNSHAFANGDCVTTSGNFYANPLAYA